MIVGSIKEIMLDPAYLSDEYYIDLEMANSSGVSGLNSYLSLRSESVYPYARIEELPSLME